MQLQLPHAGLRSVPGTLVFPAQAGRPADFKECTRSSVFQNNSVVIIVCSLVVLMGIVKSSFQLESCAWSAIRKITGGYIRLRYILYILSISI